MKGDGSIMRELETNQNKAEVFLHLALYMISLFDKMDFLSNLRFRMTIYSPPSLGQVQSD